jgi:hypothetical protein
MAPIAPRHRTRSRNGGALCADVSWSTADARGVDQRTLSDVLTHERRVIVFGEDVGVKAGSTA